MATVPEELKTKKDDAPVVETIAEVIETPVDKAETPVDKAENPVATKTAEPQGFYADYFAKYGPNKPMSEAELAKEAKKRKREKIFAAIGDGISALSNLYFTTKGAPNATQNPMSDKVKARWDAIEAERKGNETAWYQGYQQALQLDEARAAAKRKEKADEKAYDLRVKEYQRKVDKDEMEAKVWELERQRKEHLIDKAEYEARLAKILADYAEKNGVQMGKAKIGGGSSSGGNQGTNPIYAIKDGKVVIVGYSKSFDSAVAESRRNGVNIKKIRKTTKDIMDTTNTSEWTTQIEVPDGKGGWKVVDVSAESTADNTPPSRKKSEGKTNDNNDNTPPSRRR